MTNTKSLSEFFIYHDKYQALDDVAQDWFIKSFKLPYESPEWKICRLKYETARKASLKFLKAAIKELNG